MKSLIFLLSIVSCFSGVLCGDLYGKYPVVGVTVEDLKSFGTAIKGGSLANVEMTVFELNGTSGVIREQWFTGGGENWAQTRVRIYIDGETTASIDYLLFLAHGIGFNEEKYSPFGTARVGKVANNGGLYNTYQIPFGKSVKVTLTGTSAKPVIYWYIIRGVEKMPVFLGNIQLPDNARLKLSVQNNITKKPLEFVDLVQVDKGGGALYQVTIQAQSTDFNYLEACVRAYIDGSKDPMFLSSGTEDYFLSAFYFNTGVYHLDNSGLTHFDPSKSQFAAYKFHENDPILFKESFGLKWRIGEDGECPHSWGVREEKTSDRPVNLAETTLTTYTWVYVW